MTCSAVSGTGYRWPRTRLHQSCQLFRSGLATPRLGEDRPPLKAVAFGVGHNPNSVPKLSETSVGSRYAVPFCIKPERGQVSKNSVKPPSKECCDVLHDDEFDFSSLTKLAKNSSVIGPEAASFSIKAISASGEADILTGESAANCIDGNSIGSKPIGGEGSDIVVTGDARPMLGEDALTERFPLAERDGSHSSPLKSEGEAADPAEKVQDIHSLPRCVEESEGDALGYFKPVFMQFGQALPGKPLIMPGPQYSHGASLNVSVIRCASSRSQ